MTGLRVEFGPEFGYWSPVLLFVVFALLLIFHGRRLRRDEPISLLESGEVLGLLVATAAAGYLALIEGP